MKNKGHSTATLDQRKMLCKNLGFTATEQYKVLRANILFALPDEQQCRIIGVTSSVRGEGKSTTSINLSYSLAETGKRVLLIDGDLRLPSVAKKMEMKGTPGLSNILVDGERVEVPLYKSSQLSNWYILPSGDIPPNPSELLGSRRMQKLIQTLSERFDFIIVDLPPVDVVSDAIVLSPLIHGIIVVTREDYTSRKEISRCMAQLQFSNIKVLGFVMTNVKSDSFTSKYYKKYYRSSSKT